MKTTNQTMPDVVALAAQFPGLSTQGLQKAYEGIFSPFSSEKVFVAVICEWLHKEGWTCRRGRIDILATRKQEIRLIEVKNTWDRHSCAEALGELLMSAPEYPGSELVLATPRRPAPEILCRLALYHVTLLDGPWL